MDYLGILTLFVARLPARPTFLCSSLCLFFLRSFFFFAQLRPPAIFCRELYNSEEDNSDNMKETEIRSGEWTRRH